MKRIVVHVGLPKCGSSSIQATFARARDRLRAEGIDYPELEARYGRGKAASLAPGHMLLRTEVRRAHLLGDRMPVLDGVLAGFDASDAHTLVLSSEGFFYMFMNADAEYRPFLTRRLEGRDVEIVAFFRRRDRLALSQYKQVVKDVRRVSRTFEEMLADRQSRLMRRMRVDPAEQMARVAAAFAARTCTPICLDAPGSDAVALLGARIGVEMAAHRGGDGARTNASPSDVEIAYLARCNAEGMPDDAYFLRRVALEGIDVSDVAPGFRLASDAALRDLAAGTVADYAALDRAYGFAHPPVVPPSGDRPADRLAPEAVAEIERRVAAEVEAAPRRVHGRAESLVRRRAAILAEAEADPLRAVGDG